MSRVRLEPHRLFRRLPLAPHQMQDRLTRVEDAIVLCHLGVPRIAREHWSLTIDGLVASPLTLTFADLGRFAKFAVTSVHQCAGNPLQPCEPSQRVCNLKWGGVRLADILSLCRPSGAAAYVWATGADFGTFGGVTVDAYVKDLPMARAMGDVLLAFEMNDAPLAPEHGYPARLVVPGFYGTNSVKWLTRLTLAASRAQGPFTMRWYNDPVPDAAAAPEQQTVPVWSIAPQSVIVTPAPGAALGVGRTMQIAGWAWADGGVRSLDVAAGEEGWQPAVLEAPTGRAWQRFSLAWTPSRCGPATLASRAVGSSGSGDSQPESGRRNAIHRVPVTVR